MLNSDTVKDLQNSYAVVKMYFEFCQLGYFFDGLSKRINFTRIATPIEISDGSGKYAFDNRIITESLDAAYKDWERMSSFLYLAILNSLRGVAAGVREVLDNQDIRDIFLNDIFKGDNRNMESFDGVARFIRNALSHNINDRIELEEQDFIKQKTHWMNRLRRTEMHLYYDYSDPNSTIHNPEYKTVCDIKVNWANVNAGGLFGNVIPTFQYFMFMEFCYNALITLRNKYLN